MPEEVRACYNPSPPPPNPNNPSHNQKKARIANETHEMFSTVLKTNLLVKFNQTIDINLMNRFLTKKYKKHFTVAKNSRFNYLISGCELKRIINASLCAASTLTLRDNLTWNYPPEVLA